MIESECLVAPGPSHSRHRVEAFHSDQSDSLMYVCIYIYIHIHIILDIRGPQLNEVRDLVLVVGGNLLSCLGV